MALFLDSALLVDAQRAASSGLVRGITTNPALLAKTGLEAREVIAGLCNAQAGMVFYQLEADTLEGRLAEARQMADRLPGKIGLKIATTSENLGLAAKLAGEGYVVGMTAIFDAAQVYLACQTGARYVLPYVNRSTRLLGDGPGLVRQMRQVIEAEKSPLEILAASIKSPEEAVATVLAGAHHLTLPWAVIEQMGKHALSEQAVEEFAEARGKNSASSIA